MYRLNVPAMTCGGCARRVTNAILEVDPAAQVKADPPSREVTITTQVDEQALLAALAEAGYPAETRNGPTPL